MEDMKMSEGKFQENKDWNHFRTTCERGGEIVRGQVPRKQGLKLIRRAYLPLLDFCPRASSKKTRIETNIFKDSILVVFPSEGKFQENKDWNTSLGMYLMVCPLSEGKFQENKDWNYHNLYLFRMSGKVRGQVPRKQGLKQNRVT